MTVNPNAIPVGTSPLITVVETATDGSTVTYPVTYGVTSGGNVCLPTAGPDGEHLQARVVGQDTLTVTVTNPDGTQFHASLPVTVIDPTPPKPNVASVTITLG